MKHIALNAHLLSGSAGYRRAGIHQYIYHVLEHLPTHADDFSFTALANHPIDIDHPHFKTQVSTIDTSRPLPRILWEQVMQPLALRHLKPDLYHAMAFVAPLIVPSPFVVTVFDLSFLRYPEVLTTSRRLYLKTFTKQTCQRANRVLAISQSTAQDLVELMGIDAEKIDIAYPGVSEDFKPLPADQVSAFRHKNNLPERFFLFVGTLEPRKNLPMLIRAYAQLPEADRKAVHLILGGGKGWLYEEIFETIAQYHLEATVHTPGYLASEDLALWYNAADALVYPTLFEGFGIPIVEALACGTSVIASNRSSLPEAVGTQGILLPPDDEVAWTESLREQIHTPNQSSSRQTERQTWAATFTWQQTASQTIASYRRALEQ